MKDRTGIAVVSFTVGAFAASAVWVLSRNAWEEIEMFIRIYDLFSWRVGSIVQPLLAIGATIYVIKGRLRRAAYLMLGYFLFEMFQNMLRTLVYWP